MSCADPVSRQRMSNADVFSLVQASPGMVTTWLAAVTRAQASSVITASPASAFTPSRRPARLPSFLGLRPGITLHIAIWVSSALLRRMCRIGSDETLATAQRDAQSHVVQLSQNRTRVCCFGLEIPFKQVTQNELRGSFKLM